MIVATHFGRQAPDSDHPYGHDRIETLATLALGSMLIFVAGAVAWASLLRLVEGDELSAPGALAIGVAVVALAAKEWIYRYTLRAARRIDSRLLEANAWHSRSDALSTVAVLVGLIGAEVGVGWLDAAVAVVVGVMIGHVGARLLWESSRELIDTAVPEDERRRMSEVALGVPGVRGVHQLRSRTLGGEVFVDLHIVVPARVSVSEGHEIGNEVARRLRAAAPHVTDITFHIDPENDEEEEAHGGRETLPLRRDVERMLDEVWADQPVWRGRVGLDLHYLDEDIDVSLYVREPADGRSLDEAASALRAAASALPWLGRLRLWEGPGQA